MNVFRRLTKIFLNLRMSEDVFQDVDALELFKSEIRSDDLAHRVECISYLNLIAHAMGKANALSILVPLISECVKGVFCSDDDEVLLSFAKYIPIIVPHLPADSGVAAVVPILESLASQDETVIREAAVLSLGKLAEENASVCLQVCYPALLRLFKAEWFSPRLSACGLAHYIYPHVNEESRTQIRSLFVSCANDETPMVKRAAAAHLHSLVEVVEKKFVIDELVPIYQNLAVDETQETVRSSSVPTTVSLSRIFDESEARQHLRDTMAELSMDKSWRVRLAVVKVYGQLCKSIGKDATRSHMLEPLILLMRDQEPDVRKAAVLALEDTAGLITVTDFESSVVPLFPVISKDPVQQVRSALSSCIGPLAKILGKEFTATHLLPLLMESVKDEHPTIRYNATGNVGSICQVLAAGESSEATATQLVSLLHTLSQDSNWRTRLAVLEQVPTLCSLFGQELFEAKLESLFLSFFGDSVHAVRAALTASIGKLVEQLGEDWTVNHFANKVLVLYSETNSYSSRVALLQTLPKLASVMTNPEDVKRLIIHILEKGCKDVVPNVRFVACRVARDLLKSTSVSSAANEGLKPSLEPLVNDQDIDVRYFAHRAIETVS